MCEFESLHPSWKNMYQRVSCEVTMKAFLGASL